MNIVLKLGGSLMDNITEIVNHIIEYINTTSEEMISVVIVPGGGVFADCVRDISKKYHISNDTSHWIAIASMEQYAYYIIDKTGLESIDTLSELYSGIVVLKPYQYLKNNDELPHGWNVTSDTIGAWVAKKLDASFIKITDVDGIFKEQYLVSEINASDIDKLDSSCTDKYMPEFLKDNRMNCYIVNGYHPERITDALRNKPVTGTYIKGNI
jgi:hypothetical protein